MSALPAGFSWDTYLDGWALYLGRIAVAMIVPTKSGKWRADLNPNRRERRHAFFVDAGTAAAYVEAWARRWAPQLAECYRDYRWR